MEEVFGFQRVDDFYILHFRNVDIHKSKTVDNAFILKTKDKEKLREIAEIILKKYKVMEVENRSKIKEVIVLQPEYVASNFGQLVKKEYEDIQDLKSRLAKLRMEANELEAEIKTREDKFRDLSHLFTLKFETEDIEYSTNKCSLAIINREDARNI